MAEVLVVAGGLSDPGRATSDGRERGNRCLVMLCPQRHDGDMHTDRQLHSDRKIAPTVLVTGSSGSVGSSVACALCDAGWQVKGADLTPGRWTTVVGNLQDAGVRGAALAGAQVVVHAAGLHAPQLMTVSEKQFWDVNVSLTEALLNEALKAGVERFVYTSSTSVYGYSFIPVDRTVWVDETLPVRPRDVYDETKLAAERAVAACPMPTVILRIARCSPGPTALLAEQRLNRGVAVADVACAHVLAVQNSAVTGVLNIAGPLLFEREDAIELYHSADNVIRRRAPEIAQAFAERGWPLPHQLDRVYDSGAAGRAIGYKPAEGVVQLLGEQ
jgi:UDP-glucose 4-epimerase